MARLILTLALFVWPLRAQEPSDLQVQLRSATGSNRFQIGEVIPLEVVLSSSTPNRYLEPCALFRESNFGFPLCRFFSKWSFTITPDGGWVDLTKEFPSGPATSGGPSFEVPDRDLSSQPESFPYVLTHRFRFDRPDEYRVQLSLDVGLDDETTQRMPALDAAVKAHSLTVKPEIVLQIVPASAEWQKEVIRNGYEAYSGPIQRNTNPPSPEFLRYQQATQALCNLGTPEAARVLVGLLSPQHEEVTYCLDHTPSADAAIKEMQRLLVDPDVAVNGLLFSELVRLLGVTEFKSGGSYMISWPAVDREREVLLSALPQKRGEAQVTSLVTALQWPARAKGAPYDSGYELPFAAPVIAAVAAHYDSFPSQSQEWLLGDAWARVRSPLMLPVVRRFAEAGNRQALLRWMELDPMTATDFARKEVVRPVPRFSSFYLRLPEASLPEQVAQLAANFVALTQNQDLYNGATLLHRYATSAVLPVVLPFNDAKHATWPLSVQFLMLGYLLKVSPEDGGPRVEQLLQKTNQEPWQSTFFTDIGSLEPSPVLERLAIAQIEAGTQPLANDAIEYLRLRGSAAAKPLVWKQLARWQGQLAASTEKTAKNGALSNEGRLQQMFVNELTDAFVSAQGWVLSPEESSSLQALLGEQTASQLSCRFKCGASLGTGPSPASYAIYGKVNRRPRERAEYMNPTERLQYFINQYRCVDMRALKQKILQLPAGSSFDFAYDFSAADRDELVEISDFLWGHGYKVRNPQNWNFLRPDPPR